MPARLPHRPIHSPPDRPRGESRIVLTRRTVAVLGVAASLILLWAIAATTFIVSRDEIAQRLFIRETEMTLGYEDRIGRLAGHLEREVTQNLVERNAVDARIGAIAARQAEIEVRQAWLRGAAERVIGPVDAPAPSAQAREGRDAGRVSLPNGTKPEPLADLPGFRLRDSTPSSTERDDAPRRDRLSALEAAVERVAAEERTMVTAFGRLARTHVARLRSAIDATGIEMTSGSVPAAGIGGPLVTLPDGTRRGQLGFLMDDLDVSFAELTRLQAAARSLPLGSPLAGDAEQTSGFGYRLDPFTRGPALHTGLDFRAESGTPARATAAGRVVAAEYAGGYGLMVEIDHGGGLTTRYGHLSAFAVAPGERVEAGQTVGRTGSTGRSTGAHLHYETRVNGEPVNPVRFLEAGRLLLQRRG